MMHAHNSLHKYCSDLCCFMLWWSACSHRWGVKLLLELLSQQLSLCRSVCPFFFSFFLSLSLFAFWFYTLSASCFLSLSFLSVQFFMPSSLSTISPSPILSFLSPIWLCCHGDLLFCLSCNAFHKSVSMDNVTHMRSAQRQRGNDLL